MGNFCLRVKLVLDLLAQIFCFYANVKLTSYGILMCIEIVPKVEQALMQSLKAR